MDMRVPGDLNARVNRQRVVSVGSVTLTAGGTTTVVSNLGASAQTYPFFVPLTANAAAEIGAGTMYVSARTKWEFTITHANNAQVDRTFGYQLVAGDLTA
jgi:hypothetical protein